MADTYVTKIHGLEVWFGWDKKAHRWEGTIYPKGFVATAKRGAIKIPGGSGSTVDEAEANTRNLIWRMQTGRRDPRRHSARDVDDAPPSTQRVPRTKSGYRFAVEAKLVREHRMTDARAARLVQKWQKLVESRRKMGRTPASTAEHVARFERQQIVSPYGRDARKRRRS